MMVPRLFSGARMIKCKNQVRPMSGTSRAHHGRIQALSLTGDWKVPWPGRHTNRSENRAGMRPPTIRPESYQFRRQPIGHRAGGESMLQDAGTACWVFRACNAKTGRPRLEISTIARDDGWPRIAVGSLSCHQGQERQLLCITALPFPPGRQKLKALSR